MNAGEVFCVSFIKLFSRNYKIIFLKVGLFNFPKVALKEFFLRNAERDAQNIMV
jgi:hypothetical protein